MKPSWCKVSGVINHIFLNKRCQVSNRHDSTKPKHQVMGKGGKGKGTAMKAPSMFGEELLRSSDFSGVKMYITVYTLYVSRYELIYLY